MTDAKQIYGQKWSEKEYLLVLNAYLNMRGHPQHANLPIVQELSEVLGRTPHSILYRLQNYASIDPVEADPRRKGKIHITEYGRSLFDKWVQKPEHLSDVAEAFMRDEKSQMEPDLFNPYPVRLSKTFQQYELLDEIGRGSFGVVFSCLDTKTQDIKALKIIDNTRVHDPECIHRFRREIRALRIVDHPNVIRIYFDNLDEEDNYPGFVMDLAEMDLPKYLSQKSQTESIEGDRPIVSSDEACKLIVSIMNSVICMHESGVLHRDINPNNILRMFDGRWTLADFSLAKLLPPKPVSTSFETSTHMAMGTVHYTSPEQYESLKNTDERTDVYSLGWLIWELMSTKGPFPRREPSGLKEGMERIFLKAVSHDKGDRYSSVEEMKIDFDRETHRHG